MGLRESVQQAVESSKLEPRDRPAADLALTYAASIDDTGGECPECERHGGDLAKLGPLLLVALEALRMTPRARAAATKAVTNDKPAANQLDQLADRRLRRGQTADLDAAAEGSH